MADPVSKTTSMRELADRVVAERLAKMLTYAGPVRISNDIEAVHDMRVASRRLRAACSVFAPVYGPGEFDYLEREVRTVTRALGLARDLDVLVLTLEKLQNQLPRQQQDGVHALVRLKRQERQEAQSGVEAALARLELMDLPGWLGWIIDGGADSESRQAPRRRKPRMPVDPRSEVRQAAMPIIAAAVDEVLAWERESRDPHKVFELHQMRIAAKRLRYTLEIFEPFYDADFAAAIERVKAIQELLGEIHDADVLIPQLATQATRELEPLTAKDVVGLCDVDLMAVTGLLMLCRRKAQERAAQYRTFQVEWRRFRADNMLEVLKGRPRRGRKLRAAAGGGTDGQ